MSLHTLLPNLTSVFYAQWTPSYPTSMISSLNHFYLPINVCMYYN